MLTDLSWARGDQKTACCASTRSGSMCALACVRLHAGTRVSLGARHVPEALTTTAHSRPQHSEHNQSCCSPPIHFASSSMAMRAAAAALATSAAPRRALASAAAAAASPSTASAGAMRAFAGSAAAHDGGGGPGACLRACCACIRAGTNQATNAACSAETTRQCCSCLAQAAALAARLQSASQVKALARAVCGQCARVCRTATQRRCAPRFHTHALPTCAHCSQLATPRGAGAVRAAPAAAGRAGAAAARPGRVGGARHGSRRHGP